MSNRKKRPDPISYRERKYRGRVFSPGMKSCHVAIRETDLFILADNDVEEQATHLVMQYRSCLESYISHNSSFLTSLVPLDHDDFAPPIVKEMLAAARLAGVGPMAAVAGAIAEFVGHDLLKTATREVVIENGGDIFMHRLEDGIVAIFSGTSSLSNKVGIKISKNCMPLGICTSSGTVGHSLSFGMADSVTVLAASASLADAAATRLGNEMKTKKAMSHSLAVAKALPDLKGVVIIKDDQLGVWGDMELVPLKV